VDCDDSDSCTSDTCNKTTGKCSHTDNGSCTTGGSCVGYCGDLSGSDGICACDSSCTSFGDCCADYAGACGGGGGGASCAGLCGELYGSDGSCYCDASCSSAGDCCSDYNQLCGGGGTYDPENSCYQRCGEPGLMLFIIPLECGCDGACGGFLAPPCCNDKNQYCP
jgi:hypothetical protein